MTVDIASLVSDNLDIWTTAIERKSGLGRGGGNRINLYGIDRLRSLIVDLAVRGKLTSQQPDEEPAAMALAKFAKASRRKIELGQARKPKAVLPLPADVPNLPEGWVWTQLGTIAEISPSNSADDQVDASFVPMALVSTRIDGAHEAEIRRWSEIKKGFTHFAEGDIGLAKITPCFENGKAAIFENLANGIGAGTTELHVARPWSDDVNRRYLLLTMKTASYLHQGEARMTGTAGQKRVPRSYFESSPLPLPPLLEQQRIVAKVDELMALCDALETESASAIAAHQTLVEALLTTLTTSTDTADLAANWVRLEAHFDILFTTEVSVDALKQTILELAVRGKLVPPDDSEDAAALIQKWENAKQHLLATAGDRRIKVAPKPKAPPFDLPSHWQFQSFENIFLFIDYRGNTPPKTQSGIPLITAKNVRMGYLDREPREFISDETFSKWMSRGFPELGDLFFTTEAPLGNICLHNIEEPFAIAQRLICFKPFGPTNTRFYLLAIMSQSVQRVLDDNATGMTARGIKAAKLKSIPLPVPPEAEQARIVAKVEELMVVCDALKAHLSDAAQTQRHLADAIRLGTVA
nr:restriction endonuclease subunit S [uncultured Neokomagataea sp.]